MTNNLKCPFCGEELEKVETPLPLDSEYLFCPVDDCHNEPLKREIWQALIDGKKAQDALKVARRMYKSAQKAYIEKLFGGFPNTIKSLVAAEIHKYDDKITSLTKGK